MSGKSEERISAYKNIKRGEIQKKKRFEETIQLRKDKRSDQLQKRRNITDLSDEPISPLKENNDPNCMVDQPTITDLKEIVAGLQCDHQPMLQLMCARSARKMLSREKGPPIDEFLETGALPKLIQFLTHKDNPDLLFEAAWTITNIASGSSEQTNEVVSANGVPALMHLLLSPYLNVAEQSMWALGNIAGDSTNLRDFVLDQGILKPLQTLAATALENEDSSILRNLAWTYSNLCRNRYPPTALKYIVEMLPVLYRLLEENDVGVKTDVLWAFSYITDGPSDRLNVVLENNVHIKIIQTLSSVVDNSVGVPAIRALGNIVTGSDQQTQRVLDEGFLDSLLSWIDNPKCHLQKELAWTMSNILAGTHEQIQAVIDNGLLPWLVNLCGVGDFKTRREAAWALTNLTSSGTDEQKKLLVNNNGVEAICSLLRVQDNKILVVVLQGLLNLLAVKGLEDVVPYKIEECQGLDAIEELQNNEQDTIYNLAFKILDTYFNESQEDNVIAPSSGAAEFSFANNGNQQDHSQPAQFRF